MPSMWPVLATAGGAAVRSLVCSDVCLVQGCLVSVPSPESVVSVDQQNQFVNVLSSTAASAGIVDILLLFTPFR